ncbi:Uncharacterised protein [Legionella steigerwaltii]|uniref:Uncharacterized protein n=1 Tax=Legionella steigerwaltii TaxID=460 RepID=A0A378LBG1_9GAMM|nr:hypothetical protein Lstg_3315 [Legionella steigerwaltii]STY24047.1 Uncharacterised protein [Legionella steigerwaltii]
MSHLLDLYKQYKSLISVKRILLSLFLKIADQYASREHHLKFLISDLLLQIEEKG